MIFQTLVHIMRKIIPMNDRPASHNISGLPETGIVLESLEVLTATVDALHCYISNFDFTWSDSLETICVMPLLQKLLSTNGLSPRVRTYNYN